MPQQSKANTSVTAHLDDINHLKEMLLVHATEHATLMWNLGVCSINLRRC
jgi:hypothetical protein